jgi:heme-degrading monooxygenase HmoA
MRTLAILIFSCGAGTTLMLLTSGNESAAKEPPAKVLRHTVLYKFKEGITPTQLQEVVDAFAGLPKKIDTIAGFEKGTNISTENKSEGFTHCFVVTFHDEAGRDAYLKHPAHDDYVKIVRDRREKVIVFDYWAEK